MILPNDKPTQADFERALQDAVDGIFYSETGFSDPVTDALELIATQAPFASAQLIEAANLAWSISQQ